MLAPSIHIFGALFINIFVFSACFQLFLAYLPAYFLHIFAYHVFEHMYCM